VIAQHLRGLDITPSLVLCSSAARTRETLERILPGLTHPEVLLEPGLYQASSGDLMDRLRAVPAEVLSMMLIGHQPAIQELALELAGDGDDLGRLRAKFPTAALATLMFVGDWGELSPGCAELIAFVKPKELAAAG
jgi:phosphohistidine phosphatase